MNYHPCYQFQKASLYLSFTSYLNLHDSFFLCYNRVSITFPVIVILLSFISLHNIAAKSVSHMLVFLLHRCVLHSKQASVFSTSHVILLLVTMRHLRLRNMDTSWVHKRVFIYMLVVIFNSLVRAMREFLFLLICA